MERPRVLPLISGAAGRRASAGDGVMLAVTGAACLAAMAASVALAPGAAGWLAAGLVPVLAALAAIDARWFILPDELNAVGFALGLLQAALGAPDPMLALLEASMRGAAVALVFLAIRLGYRAWRRHDGLGLGDVKLAGVAGLWLSPLAVALAIELAALGALMVWGWARLRGKRELRLDHRLPFGLFFAPAIWVAWALDQVLIGAAGPF